MSRKVEIHEISTEPEAPQAITPEPQDATYQGQHAPGCNPPMPKDVYLKWLSEKVFCPSPECPSNQDPCKFDATIPCGTVPQAPAVLNIIEVTQERIPTMMACPSCFRWYGFDALGQLTELRRV